MYEQLCAVLDELAVRGYAPQVKLDHTGVSFQFGEELDVHVPYGIVQLTPEVAADRILEEVQQG
jgi:hypothetical protein